MKYRTAISITSIFNNLILKIFNKLRAANINNELRIKNMIRRVEG